MDKLHLIKNKCYGEKSINLITENVNPTDNNLRLLFVGFFYGNRHGFAREIKNEMRVMNLRNAGG